MNYRLLQGNLNRFRRAQDLFVYSFAEGDFVIEIAAEPHRIPANHLCWADDTYDSVAITWRWWPGMSPYTIDEQGSQYVAVLWWAIAVVGI